MEKKRCRDIVKIQVTGNKALYLVSQHAGELLFSGKMKNDCTSYMYPKLTNFVLNPAVYLLFQLTVWCTYRY